MYKSCLLFLLLLTYYTDGIESTCNSEDPGLIPGSGRSLVKGIATHLSILAWRIPWAEEPCRLQLVGPQRVRQNLATHTNYYMQYFTISDRTDFNWIVSVMKVMIDFLSLAYSILSSTWRSWQTPSSWKHFLHLNSRTLYSSCGTSYIICGPRARWKCGLSCSKSKGKIYLKVINHKKAFSFFPLSFNLFSFFCLSVLFINKEKFRI